MGMGWAVGWEHVLQHIQITYLCILIIPTAMGTIKVLSLKQCHDEFYFYYFTCILQEHLYHPRSSGWQYLTPIHAHSPICFDCWYSLKSWVAQKAAQILYSWERNYIVLCKFTYINWKPEFSPLNFPLFFLDYPRIWKGIAQFKAFSTFFFSLYEIHT